MSEQMSTQEAVQREINKPHTIDSSQTIQLGATGADRVIKLGGVEVKISSDTDGRLRFETEGKNNVVTTITALRKCLETTPAGLKFIGTEQVNLIAMGSGFAYNGIDGNYDQERKCTADIRTSTRVAEYGEIGSIIELANRTKAGKHDISYLAGDNKATISIDHKGNLLTDFNGDLFLRGFKIDNE
jgi:hypothetical protein